MAQNRRPSIYWRVYLAVAAVLFVALGIWLVILYGMLDKHEASQPKYYAEAAFNEEFDKFDPEEFVKKYYVEKEDAVPVEVVIDYIKSVTDGKKLTYNKTSSSDGTLKYVVTAGEGENSVKIASFVLVEEKSKEKPYSVKEYILNFDSSMYNSSVVVEVPRGYTVLINGNTLGKDNIIEDEIPTDSCNFMPEGVKGLTYTKYEARHLKSDYKLEVLDTDGNACEAVVTEGYCKVEKPYDTALEAEYSAWILEGAELYARYAQFDEKINVVYFNQVAPYFDPGSDLYESIRTMDNGFVIYYDAFEFTDKSATEFMKYDDNTFSCRVKLTQTMYKNVAGGEREEYVDYIDQTLYLRRVDGKFLIYNMFVH